MPWDWEKSISRATIPDRSYRTMVDFAIVESAGINALDAVPVLATEPGQAALALAG